MAYKTYLKMDGIFGSSIDVGHTNEIDIVSFGIETKGPREGSGTSSANQRTRLTFTKDLDHASSLLLIKLRRNESIKTALLTMERTESGKVVPVGRIEMKNVLVTRRDLIPANEKVWRHEESRDLEKITLSIGTIAFTNMAPKLDFKDDWSSTG